MRLAFTIIFLILIVALVVCAVLAAKSKKSIARSVFVLTLAFIIPVLGNLSIVVTDSKIVSTVGYYIYFLGMDFVVCALMRYAFNYCGIKNKHKLAWGIIYSFLTLDIINYILQPFFHQAFATEPITVDNKTYYRLIPYLGQTYHRLFCYGVLLAVIITFFVKSIKSPKVYAERYWIILFTMIFGSLWQTYYIFSRTPIDRSMIGFAVFNILVFYFSLYYRPMRLLDRMLADVASSLPVAMVFFDGNGTPIWINRPTKELLDTDGRKLDATVEKIEEMFGEIRWSEDDWFETREIGEDENKQYYTLEKRAVTNDLGKKVGSLFAVHDITEETRTLEMERYNATHDTLTDLYTKEYLYEVFAEMLEKNPDMDYYVIYANINDFKVVNDIFGNLFGDYVLKYIAGKIQNEMGEKAICGRFVGDNFGMCIPVDEFDEERIAKELTHFTVTDGEIEHFVLMHLGIFKVTDKTLDISYMFDRARIALSTVKEDYHTYIAYYDDKMRESVLWEQKITSQLATSLKEKQIVPFLQPIVNKDGKVVGAEALVRWNHPEEGFLSPARFIPAFEKNGMISDLDRYMWRCACEILSKWKSDGKEFFISINISPKDFYFMDVGEEIRTIVHDYGIDPARLRIEITESMMMMDQESRFNILNDFRRDGFIVEMDDFGSGYSSLNMLKDMPVDLIKIDMAFLRQSDNVDKAKIIVHNIVKLSYELGLISLTEGVETEDQFNTLSEMGCSLFQGYYFAKPMPVNEFEETYVYKIN